MRTRRRRDAGLVSTWLVLCFSVAAAAIVVSSEASIVPFHREQARLGFSDEAFALAESGVALARAQLARDGRVTPLAPTRLGRGRVSIRIERADGDDVVVVASGSADAASLVGKGGAITRRVRARLRIERGTQKAAARVSLIDWKEL